ncbi:MAG: carboxypeptidase-like regulatory domain-containing protein, partial [Pseudomonadota bacterium]
YLETIRERPIALFIGYSVNGKDKHSDHSQVLQPAVHEQPDSAMAPNEDAKAEINSPDAKRNGSGIKIQAEWIINIGGYVEACATDPNRNNGVAAVCSVSGGLQVPLYFIILALMGGSISLTRRLPELQKMASSAYVATENQPKLSQHEFREYLIFHIVQFISAPFLAILAYYLIEPGNTANSVALAFIAGFASESILLMIRSVAEKISPKTTDTTQYGTITGVVTLVQKDKTMRPATKAEVSLVDLPHVTTLTDEQGLYVLGNVPVGMNNIRVVCTGAKEKTDSVKIEHSQAVVRKNVTVEA